MDFRRKIEEDRVSSIVSRVLFHETPVAMITVMTDHSAGLLNRLFSVYGRVCLIIDQFDSFREKSSVIIGQIRFSELVRAEENRLS